MRFTVFLSCLAALALVTITGCGSQSTAKANPALQPNYHRPIVPGTTTPLVEFMGDRQIQELVAYAKNPRWRCTTCEQNQTSDQVLAEVPEVIALKPDIVIILTGAFDLIDNIETSRTQPTFSNVTTAQAEFKAAGIPAVICGLLPSTMYDSYYFNEGLSIETESGVLSNVLSLDNTDDSIPVTDGVDFSPYGLTVAYPLVYQEIQSFHKGGMK
jgi:hypothetical protein